MSRLVQLALAATFACIAAAPAPAMQDGGQAPHDGTWQPARTPPGGTSWRLLESTRLNDRTDPSTKIIYTRPVFPAGIRNLSGRQIKVAGWMMPLENGARQKHFVLLGYPPGCPFHLHALPNQFIEVYSSVPIRMDEVNPIIISGTLELTGQDESGVFYRLRNARPA
ncbi:DUF3299 domain-containing protein [Croceibacterium xixiisoli]|nr:DUF3299 domain-containing protein [Croceibacterium xixiisoli]